MVKKQTTIDDLAMMVQNGFRETAKRSDTEELKGRLDRIEKLVFADHKKRIERLEFEVNNLKDLFAMK